MDCRPRTNKTLEPALVSAVEFELSRGTSARKIARDLRLNIKTVRKIRDGVHVSQNADEPKTDRCPGCGYEVVMPCRICRDRASIAEKRANHATD